MKKRTKKKQYKNEDQNWKLNKFILNPKWQNQKIN